MIKLKDILMEQILESFKDSIMQDDNGVKRSVEAVVKFAEKNKEKYLKKDFPISKLKHELKWWDKQNKDNAKKSNARMMKADTSYPLLVIKNDSYGLSVADGLNRLKKAIDIEKKKVIDVYIVPEQDIPDYTKVDNLLESESPNLLIPRRVEGRIEKLIQTYIKNGSKGDLYLSDMNLTKLPDVLKYVDVSGNFLCDSNELTSLENAPKSVGGNFYCDNNQLTSLEGAPKSVGGYFDCSRNQLTSLVGAPQSVGGGFYCFNNVVKFTKEQVRAICNVKGSITV